MEAHPHHNSAGRIIGVKEPDPIQGQRNEEAIDGILQNAPWLHPTQQHRNEMIFLDDSSSSFWKGFTSSTAMIIATEIGDKTFFIAAVLCMRNSRIAVFGGAILALILMTIISTLMGFILPAFLPRKYTHILGGLLFLYFGYKLLRDSQALQEYKVSDELEEVEEELLHSTKGKRDDKDTTELVELQDLQRTQEHRDEESARMDDNTTTTYTPRVIQPMTSQVYKIFIQSFVLTFLAEWGDRSQIATIALAASHNPYGVTIGACFGHALCTGLAVIGGRMLASRISEKSVTFWGGWIFLAFGLHSLFFQN